MGMSICSRDWLSADDIITANTDWGSGLSTIWLVPSLMTTASSLRWRHASDDVGRSLSSALSSKTSSAIFTTLTELSCWVLLRCWSSRMVGATVLMITYYQLIVILMAEDREGDGAEFKVALCFGGRACSSAWTPSVTSSQSRVMTLPVNPEFLLCTQLEFSIVEHFSASQSFA